MEEEVKEEKLRKAQERTSRAQAKVMGQGTGQGGRGGRGGRPPPAKVWSEN